MDTPKKIKVLYIDDEQNNLNGFKATFRFDYTVLIASNVSQAYAHLEGHPDISVILCDQRMPIPRPLVYLTVIDNGNTAVGYDEVFLCLFRRSANGAM